MNTDTRKSAQKFAKRLDCVVFSDAFVTTWFKAVLKPPQSRRLARVKPGSSSRPLRVFACGLILIAAGFLTGCRSLPPIPPADLTAPGWSVKQGQAVWKPNQSRPELAGELLVATNVSGDCLVEFTKTPFTLASARQGSDRWRVEFGAGRHVWQGRGSAPRLFSWFELPRALAGQELSRAWRFTQTNGAWRLENWRNGEWLEGAFPP